MKLKAAISEGTPKEVFDAFGDAQFASAFLNKIVDSCLGAQAPAARPAEFYVQKPDETVCVNGQFGVEVRMTGVSRGQRCSAQFEQAMHLLFVLSKYAIANALQRAGSEEKVQLFCVIMLDGVVEYPTGSGEWTNTPESQAIWISSDNAEEFENQWIDAIRIIR